MVGLGLGWSCSSGTNSNPTPAPSRPSAVSHVGDGPEPPGLIFRGSDGRTLTAADLANVGDGTVDWSIVGGEQVPDEAVKLHAQGQEAGSRGEYAKALALLEKARAAAPSWPYPLYDTAFTYQLMDQPEKALAAYERVLAMAPHGYFTAMTSADCLRREVAHEWKAGICKRYMMVEFEPSTRVAALEAIVAEAPGVASAWKDLALGREDETGRVAALDQALAHKPDPETRGFALANKALALGRAGKRDEAIRILGELVLDPSSPLDVAALARVSLAQIVNPN